MVLQCQALLQLKDVLWDYGGNLISLLLHVDHNPLISQHLVLKHVFILISTVESQYFDNLFLSHPSQSTDCFTA